MTRVEGPNASQNRADEAKRNEAEPKQGEFDRVLDQRDAGATKAGGESPGTGAGSPTTGTPIGLRTQRDGRGSGGEGSGQQGDGQPQGQATSQGRLAAGVEALVGGKAGMLKQTGAASPELVPRSRPLPAGSVNLGAGNTVGSLSGAQPGAPGAEFARSPLAGKEAQAAGAEASKRLESTEGDSSIAGIAGAGPQGGGIAVAMPSPDAPVPPAVDAQAVRVLAEKLGAAMDLHLATNRPEMTIGLDLGALGSGQVSIERGKDGVSISFQLATPESAAFLAERLPQLEKALGDRGIAVSSVEASAPPPTEAAHSAPADQGGRDQSSQDQSKQQGQGDGRQRPGDGGHDDGRSRGRFDLPPDDEA